MGYSRQDLVDEAAKAGYPVSARLVTDWVDQGLLGPARRASHGKGGGRGARYEWPESQCRLLLLLLEKRATLPAIGGLCDIPVGMWLYWSVDWIEVDQVRRALATWWKRASSTNEDQSLAQARQFVQSFIPKDAPSAEVSALRDAIQNAMRSRRYDETKLKKLAEAALAGGTKRPPAPIHKDASGTIEDMLCMVHAMARYEDATTPDFLEVRARVRKIAADYVRQWDQLRRSPGGDAFQEPSWEFFTQMSCRSMVIAIGQQLRAKREGWKMPPLDLVPPNSVPYEFTLLPIRVPGVIQ
jgi:hypothetical protein